jgi:hypothetical protein
MLEAALVPAVYRNQNCNAVDLAEMIFGEEHKGVK